MDIEALPTTKPELEKAIRLTEQHIQNAFEHGKKIRETDPVQYAFVRERLIELEAHLRDLYDELEAIY